MVFVIIKIGSKVHCESGLFAFIVEISDLALCIFPVSFTFDDLLNRFVVFLVLDGEVHKFFDLLFSKAYRGHNGT